MSVPLLRYQTRAAIAPIAMFATLRAAQAAVARMPTISGNGWVALGVIAAVIGVIWLLISGALHLERRDAALGRNKQNDNGWFGIFPGGDDDDIHHGGGGEHG